MGVIAYSIGTDGDTTTVTWADVPEADTFQRFRCDGTYAEISAGVHGTFGGATVTTKGANRDADGVTLTKIGGGDAEATAEALFSIVERPGYITPTHTGGSSESVTVIMRLVK